VASAVEVRPSRIHGLGVFAVRPVAAGEVLLVADDSRVVDAAHPLRPGEHEWHCDWLGGGRVVLMGEPERYVNHCCDPNAAWAWEDERRRLVARRALAAGEEVTCDYCIDSTGTTVWQCTCGAKRCRRTLSADFFALPPDTLREYLPLLSPWFVAENASRVEALRRTL
jgi:hypothetical protein